MKRKRFNPQLTERQQLVIGFVLVILVAVSMLYCLGLASLALRQAWEQSPLRWNDSETYSPAEILDSTAAPVIEPTDTVIAPY